MFRNSDTPLVLVHLNGTTRDLGVLSSIRVQQRLSMPDLCELHYRYPQIPDDENLVGARLLLDAQMDGALQTLFDGEVTALEYRYPSMSGGYGAARNLEIVVRAYNLLHRLRKHQHIRSFENISFTQLARARSASSMASPKCMSGKTRPLAPGPCSFSTNRLTWNFWSKWPPGRACI